MPPAGAYLHVKYQAIEIDQAEKAGSEWSGTQGTGTVIEAIKGSRQLSCASMIRVRFEGCALSP